MREYSRRELTKSTAEVGRKRAWWDPHRVHSGPHAGSPVPARVNGTWEPHTLWDRRAPLATISAAWSTRSTWPSRSIADCSWPFLIAESHRAPSDPDAARRSLTVIPRVTELGFAHNAEHIQRRRESSAIPTRCDSISHRQAEQRAGRGRHQGSTELRQVAATARRDPTAPSAQLDVLNRRNRGGQHDGRRLSRDSSAGSSTQSGNRDPRVPCKPPRIGADGRNCRGSPTSNQICIARLSSSVSTGSGFCRATTAGAAGPEFPAENRSGSSFAVVT